MDYKKVYDLIVQKDRDLQKDIYTERHHIIPRSLGGSNKKDNIIRLTAREHFICHLLLTKIYPEGSIEWIKMFKAFNMMLFRHGSNQQRYINSHWYAYFKENYSKAQSLAQLGVNNTCYGSRWMIHPNTKEVKKVCKEEVDKYQNLGFIFGRSPKRLSKVNGGIVYKKHTPRDAKKQEQKRLLKIAKAVNCKDVPRGIGRYINLVHKTEHKFLRIQENQWKYVDKSIWVLSARSIAILYFEEITQLLDQNMTWEQIGNFYKLPKTSVIDLYGSFRKELKQKEQVLKKR